MALATLKEVLAIAEEKKIAIPGFNIDNIEGAQAIMVAAEEEQSPVILTIGQGAIGANGIGYMADVVKRIAASSTVPVVMHLDHSTNYDQIMQCLKAGFTSVMYDGSHGPFEENVETSKAVVRSAHALGVSVECELGGIGGVEDGMSSKANLVDLKEVEQFISEVDCDALAIGIGNAHGMYKGTPNLDFERIEACVKMGTPPLVLHGGSGTPDEMLQKAIRLGIRKINVATELRMAYLEGLESKVGTRDFYGTFNAGRQKVTEVCRSKIRLFQGK